MRQAKPMSRGRQKREGAQSAGEIAPGDAIPQADMSESSRVQLAIPVAATGANRAMSTASHRHDGCEVQVRADDSLHSLSTTPRRGHDGQMLCSAEEGAVVGRIEGHMSGVNLSVISKRVLQFSMLADAISGSDDATLGELAVQLHTPVSKLRMWGTNWRRMSGQYQSEPESMAAAALALG